MTTGPPPPDNPRPAAPRSHRAAPTTGETLRRLLPPLGAVTAVVVVIVLLLVLNNPSHHDADAGPVVTSPTATQATTAAHSPTASARPHHVRTPHPRTTHVPATPSPPSPTPQRQVVKVPVTVLNNSRITGLAARTAAQLANAGWPIRQVGNFTGQIAMSTAYYTPGRSGEVRAAHVLARQFPSVRRVLPRFSGLPGSGLTLVVTRDWSS